jgi:hypothetical protein
VGDNGEMLAAKVGEATGAMTKLLTFLGMGQKEAHEYAKVAVLAAYHHGRDRGGHSSP